MKFYIKTIAFLLILMPISLQSQNLLVDGMEWYYSVTFFWQSGEVSNHCFIDGDIEIQQKDCKIYHRELTTCNQRFYEMEYLYEENQSVFFYDFDTETFKLLYDYAMEVGDTLTLELWNGMAFENDIGEMDSLYYMTVDSIDLIELNDTEFKRFHVRYDKWNDYEIEFTEHGIIIEYLGNIVDYFHFRDNSLCDDKYNKDIRCFDHPEYGFIQLSSVACDSIISNVNDKIDETKLTVFPNPTTQKVTITVEDLSIEGFQLFDFQGKNMGNSAFQLIDNQIVELNLANFTNGVYYVELQSNEGRVSKKIIKQK